MRRLLLSLLAAAALLATAGPTAGAARLPKAKQFKVDVTGAHHVDWSLRETGWPDSCRTWSAGEGSQTIGFSTPKPHRYALSASVWVPIDSSPDKLAIARKVTSWEDHVPPGRCSPCEQEGGGCTRPTPDPGPPPAPQRTCDRRKVPGAASVAYFPKGAPAEEDDEPLLAEVLPAFQVTVGVLGDARYPKCYPELHHGRIITAMPQKVTLRLPKLRPERMRVGQRRTLHAAVERYTTVDGNGQRTTDSCPTGPPPIGYAECAVTDVRLTVRRVA